MITFPKAKEVKKVEAAKPAVKKVEAKPVVKVELKKADVKKATVPTEKQRLALLERKVASLEKKLEAKAAAKKK